MSMALSFPEFYPAIVSIPQFSIGGLTLGPINILWYAMAYVLGLVLENESGRKEKRNKEMEKNKTAERQS